MLHSKIEQILESLGTSPNMLYGQHFLIDEKILEKECRMIGEMGQKNILEIGSGVGILTKRLIEEGKCILCSEKDEVLNAYLKQEGLEVYGDIFKCKHLIEGAELVIGNIPYDICTGLFEILIEHHKEFIGIVPYSFAKMLTTSLFYQSYYITTIQESIGGNAFYPTAKTQSALIHCSFKSPQTVPEQFIHCLMQEYKYKKLKNALQEVYIHINGSTKREAKQIIAQYHFDFIEKQVRKLSHTQREILCQQLNDVLS